VKAAHIGHAAQAPRGTRTAGITEGAALEITDFKAVPAGLYMPLEDAGIPKTYADLMAALGVGDDKVLLLVETSEFNGHRAFDAVRRIEEGGIRIVQPLRASRGVIKAVHDEHKGRAAQSETKQSDIERIAWALVDRAVESGASDIHIETRGVAARVYFRIHGERVKQPDMSTADATAMCNVLYGFHADTSGKEVAWDADTVKESSIEHQCRDGRRVQLRFESTPIHPASQKNFQVVMRVLMMESNALALEQVGYSQAQLVSIKDMLIGAQGMVVLVGPTNSGKSTSNKAFMDCIFAMRGDTTKVVTVEDPVEYIIEGACQMGVPKGRKGLQSSDGSIFTTFLKATLRLDPDVVMVGEIRDRESAGATKDLVLAGRKLLTTLHVFEVLAVFARLRELGVPPSVLYMEGFISGVIYQRLVPMVCPHCAIPLSQAVEQDLVRESTLERLKRILPGRLDGIRVRHHAGCEHCKGTGIVGRTPCAEVLVPDSVFLAHLRAGDEAGARARWHANSDLSVEGLGVTAVAHAISKMRVGMLDPMDIENQLGPLVLRRAEDFAVLPGLQVHDGNDVPSHESALLQ